MAIKETFTDGETTVDAYSIPNNEAKDYIQNRETLYRETVRYYEEKGLKVERQELGSQDGEYVNLLNDSILYLLDANSVEIWKKSKDIKDFLNKYKKFLNEL